MCVNSVSFQDTIGWILCQLCNLPDSTHSYTGDQTSVLQVVICCMLA